MHWCGNSDRFELEGSVSVGATQEKERFGHNQNRGIDVHQKKGCVCVYVCARARACVCAYAYGLFFMYCSSVRIKLLVK